MPSSMAAESNGLAGLSICCLRHCRPRLGNPSSSRATLVEEGCAAQADARRSAASALLRRFARGDLLDHVDDAAAKLGVGEARERARQRQSFRGGEEIGDVSRRVLFEVSIRGGPGAGRALEQERYRDLQDVADLLQPAGADAVGTLFVFLHLLERQAQSLAELFLTHLDHETAHAHAAADVFVNRIGRFRWHSPTPWALPVIVIRRSNVTICMSKMEYAFNAVIVKSGRANR